MLLLDMNQITLASMMVESKGRPTFDANLIKHMVVNSIRANKVKFHREYGSPILCWDGSQYWRRDVYPYYKHRRRKDKQDDGFDWKALYALMDELRNGIIESFPYKSIWCVKAEADDIIATLVKHTLDENILIVSGDTDFCQLQKYCNVRQWAPVQKKFVTCDNPQRFLKEHIITGDAGDGVPNILSDDDVFAVEGKRQKPIRQKNLEVWWTQEPEMFCTPEMKKNYLRNMQLVDLGCIPFDVEASIMEEWKEKPIKGDLGTLRQWMIENRMRNLFEHLTEF